MIDAVLERDSNVVGEGREAADPRAIDDVPGALKGTASILGRLDARRQLVDVDNRLQNLLDQAEVAFVDVSERDIDVAEFGNAKHVGDKFTSEPDAAGADDRDLQSRHWGALACFRVSGRPAWRQTFSN